MFLSDRMESYTTSQIAPIQTIVFKALLNPLKTEAHNNKSYPSETEAQQYGMDATPAILYRYGLSYLVCLAEVLQL